MSRVVFLHCPIKKLPLFGCMRAPLKPIRHKVVFSGCMYCQLPLMVLVPPKKW
jgi:hypothetical protein